MSESREWGDTSVSAASVANRAPSENDVKEATAPPCAPLVKWRLDPLLPSLKKKNKFLGFASRHSPVSFDYTFSLTCRQKQEEDEGIRTAIYRLRQASSSRNLD